MLDSTQTQNEDFPGARWVRASLQVNPYEYKGNPAPSKAFASESDYNEALLDACDANDISLIAITDHWRASSAAGLIAAADGRGIVALPGFEANSSEGVHLLVIFEAGTDLEEITKAIGACSPVDSDPHALARRNLAEITEEMTNRGALVIPAHANVATSGLLSRANGKVLQAMVTHKHINALGITPSAPPMGDQEAILANRAPYKRPHALTAVYADDVSHPSTFSTQGASSWFKMCEPGLDGLKHAIRIFETRVSVSDPASSSRVLLRELTWHGGFLDGQILPIAEDLTALIGGRGTGKSTAIESLRYVLEIDPIGDAARKERDSLVKHVLRTATTVTLTVDVNQPTPARYTIERTVPDPAVVKDASGSATKLRPVDVVGPLEIFGQHELAELAQNKTLMAELVSRVAGKPEAAEARPGILQKLEDNRATLARIERDQVNLEAELADIPRLSEQEEKFEESDLSDKLKERTTLAAEDAVFNEADTRITALEERFADLDLPALAEEIRSPLGADEQGPRFSILKQAAEALENAALAVEELQNKITTASTDARTATTKAKDEWSTSVKPIQEANTEVFRQLIEDGHDPDTYVATKEQLARLTKRAEQRKVLQGQHKKATEERNSFLQSLSANDTATAKELSAAITSANKLVGKSVVIRPIANPDRAHLKDVLDKHFSTARTQIVSAFARDDFSVRSFVSDVRSGAAALETYGIKGAQLSALIQAGEPFLREFEELSVGRVVDVLLNIAPKGGGSDLRRLEELSKGQRATALLLLLLGASTNPLVIDQPEDDLDNRFVYDGVVPRLRDLKGTRQVIVSTHNANVPVLGDAELVVTLEGDGQHGWVAEDGIGSFDTPSVREYAEDLLEGGKDAFNARKHLYGI